MARIGGTEVTAPYALVALLPALAAAVLVAGVVRGGRNRRGVLAVGGGSAGAGTEDPLVAWITELRRTPDQGAETAAAARAAGGVSRPRAADRRNPCDEPPVRPEQPPSVPAGGTLRGGREAEGGARWASWDAVDRSPWPWPAGDDRGATGSTRPGGGGPDRLRPPARRDARRPGGTPAPTAASTRRPGAATGPPGEDRRPAWLRSYASTASRGRILLLAASAGTGVGLLLAGPVAAVAVGAYGTLAARALLRRREGRYAVRARRRRLDQLCGLAADLRAGLPVPVAAEQLTSGDGGIPGRCGTTGGGGTTGDGGSPGGGGTAGGDAAGRDERGRPGRLDHLARAAVRLADQTGAPLAELLERIEADARSADRGLAAAEAQAAGARATALLLAALPLGGIGLGYGIGVDPVAVLLHTPVGGACAVVAIALQVAGLFWAERLGATPGRAS